MSIQIKTQKVHTFKKSILKDGLKGRTELKQMASTINVAATSDHIDICKRVFGKPDTDTDYPRWKDVSAWNIVELIFQIEIAEM